MPEVFDDGIQLPGGGDSEDITVRLGQLIVTGLLTGGELSINGGDNTKFDIAAGEGIVVDSHTDPRNPVVTQVKWSAFTGLTPVGAPADLATRVAIDSAGAVVQQVADFTTEQSRDLIILGGVGHPFGPTITSVGMSPHVAFNRDLDTTDLFEAIGSINVSGNVFGSNGPNLKLDKSAGTTFAIGTNYATSKKSPSVSVNAALTALPFSYVFQDGLGDFTGLAPGTDIDPAQYDDGSGTLAPVAVGEWTVQLIFYFPATDQVVVHYGQTLYPTRDDAVRGRTDPAEVLPEAAGTGTFRGWLIVRGDATDLSVDTQAVFFSAGKFGQTEAISGSASEAGASSLLYPARNESGALIPKGTLVYAAGFSVGFQRTLVDVADKDTAAKRPAIGVAKADIPDGENADLVVVGVLSGFDTSSFGLTDQLVLGSAGAFSLPPPLEDPFTGDVQMVGSVVRVDATLGEVFVTLATGLIPPTADQTFALAGTDGTPSKTNPYVTDSDPRNTDARTPTAHAGTHVPGAGDPLATAAAAKVGPDTVNAEGVAASFARSDHTHEVGIPISEANATTPAAITSATDVLMTGMTLTPGAGDYLAVFSAVVEGSTDAQLITTTLYVNGVAVPDTAREHTVHQHGGFGIMRGGVSIVKLVAALGAGQAVDVRWRTSAGTATVRARSLQLMRRD